MQCVRCCDVTWKEDPFAGQPSQSFPCIWCECEYHEGLLFFRPVSCLFICWSFLGFGMHTCVCCGLRLLLKLILAVAAFSSLFAASFLARAKHYVYSFSWDPPKPHWNKKWLDFGRRCPVKKMCFHCQEKYYVIVSRHGCKHGW